MKDKDKKSNQNKRNEQGAGKQGTGKPGVSSSATQSSTKNQSSKKAPATSAAASSNETRRTTSASAGSSRATTTTTQSTASSSGNNRNNTTHQSTVTEKKSGGWLPPVALLFGVLGTALSAILWSKLNALGETTTSALSQQQETVKSEISTVKTEIDTVKTDLTSALDEKTAALDEKTAAVDASVSEVKTAVDESVSGLQTSMTEMQSDLSAKIDTSAGEMQAQLETAATDMRAEAKTNSEEVATSTATAVQELTTKSEAEFNVISTSFNTGIRTLREDVEAKFAENDSQISGLTESLQTTHELASRGQRDWILAEVEYLLRTGHHRVKLAGDVKAGVLALESANDRLHALGDIDYFPVREQIKQEVTELRRLGPPDIEGLIFRLETAGKVADSLPLRENAKPASEDSDASGSEGGAASVGKSLLDRMNFSIAPSDPAAPRAKKRNKPTKVQLSASEALNTHLQAARLSALRADAERFHNHMDNALKYTDEIFDSEQESVKTYVADLQSIRETSIVPDIPILGSALSVFEKIDAKRGE